MHDRKAMRNAEYPECAGGESIGKVVAMVEKGVGGVCAVVLSGEVFLFGEVGGDFVQSFGELGFAQEEFGDVGAGVYFDVG